MYRLPLVFLAVLLSITGCQPTSPSTPRTQHFLVIGVDGLSPDGIRKAATPNIDRLMVTGASTLTARAVLPSSSSPNWASMIMGAGPEQHGITSNEWEIDDHELAPMTHTEGGRFPTIFTLLHEQKPEATTGAIYHWKGFGRLFHDAEVDYVAHGETEEETAKLAAAFLREQKPNYLFVHLDHVDGAGHHFGHGSPEYYASVSRADSLIGQILHALDESGMASQTTILLTADHGGKHKGHGGESLAEMEIPFILSGKGVKPGYSIAHAVSTVDNSPTAAWALGLEAPYAWTGRPVKTAFLGESAPANSALKPVLPRPSLVQSEEGDSLKLELYVSEAFIGYTLDGSEPTETSSHYEMPLTLKAGQILKAKAFREGYAPSSTLIINPASISARE